MTNKVHLFRRFHASPAGAEIDSARLARRCLVAAAVMALAVATLQLGSAPAANADNDFAGGLRTNQTYIAAIRGTQDIRTNPSPPGGSITWAHPFQQSMPASAFYAVGTYKGDDVAGTGCVTNNGSWSSYIDGQTVTGNYFCNLIQSQAYTAGSTPNFQIARVFCSNGLYGWAVSINGTERQCRSVFTEAGDGGYAGLEVLRPCCPTATAYNIDVKHTGLQNYRFGAWQAFDADILNTRATGYSVGRPNNQRVNAWHGTLD